jgi:L-aminopeptidase/D-esterase-like protein
MIKKRLFFTVFTLMIFPLVFVLASENTKPRARVLGIPFDGTPGPLNAITDVSGVEVGHTTLISGNGELQVGVGPIRTGVTAIFPRGKKNPNPVFAGWFSQNGNGEMTGTTWIEESGFLEGPVMITNTLNVGIVHHSVISWGVKQGSKEDRYRHLASLPVIAETWDGHLNDILGQHIKEKHVFQAIESASSGPVAEGNVGGGTGMICHGFKGGIGTASRTVAIDSSTYTIGVLVQANYGSMNELRIAGIPVGREIREIWKKEEAEKEDELNLNQHSSPDVSAFADKGSIIIVIATDAPVLARQLKRLARRASMGLARVGSYSGNGSGDIFVAFSTANQGVRRGRIPPQVTMLTNSQTGRLFLPVIQAIEEAIINALVGAETMTGIDGHTIRALPHDLVRKILKKYNRLLE